MRKQRLVIAGVSLLAVTMAMSACGTRSADPPTGSGSNAAAKVATIGLIAPLTGNLAPLGLGMKNSVDLAIKQANEANTIPGWKLELDAQDDTGLPDPGRNAATKLAADDAVIGVVGTLNSSVAQAVQPVLNSANIVEVSPANTGTFLTKGPKLDSPKRPYPNYFRTCTTDAIQGPFAAQYLYTTAGIKKIATIHDKKAYGQGLVEAFTEEYKKLGGEVVAAETINPDDSNFNAVVGKIKPSAPEALYYGGEYPQAGPLSQQMKGAGLDIPLMGGDGIFDPKFIEQAGGGDTADGDLATSVGAPTESLTSAKAFVDAYTAGGYKDPYGAYGAYSYDAANAIIKALATSLPNAADAKSARQPTIEAMKSVTFDGATGKVGFDEFGDATARVLTVYKVDGGKWKAEKTDEFK